MNDLVVSNFNSAYFSSSRFDESIIIRFDKNILPLLLDLDFRDTFFSYLDKISKDESLKVVILNNQHQNIEKEEYLFFFQQLLESKLNKIPVNKFCNIIDQYITKIIQLEKIVISLHQGNVFFLYFYIGLACDHRIASDNTIINNPCLDYGLPLKATGAFFLSNLIGRSKTYDFIFSKESITASKALQLGIIDKVVTEEELENEALEKAKQLKQTTIHQISTVKKMVNFSLNDLDSYLELENECFIKNVCSSDTWEDIQNKAI